MSGDMSRLPVLVLILDQRWYNLGLRLWGFLVFLFCFVSPLYWVWLQASQQRRSTMLGEWQVILCLIVNTSPVFSFLTGPVSSPCCWHLCRIWNFQQQHPAEHEVWWAWGAFSLAIAIPFCNEWRLRQHILHLVKRVSRVPLESPPRWPSG